MEAEKPIPLAGALRAVHRWSLRRVCILPAFTFAVILAASWSLTPIEPYATLNLDDGCGMVVFSPDGTMLVTSGNQDSWSHGPLRVWDVERGHERFSLAHSWKAIETVLFSPDSSLLAAHEQEDELKLWDTRTGKEHGSLAPEIKFTRRPNFRFSPDGRFLVFHDYSKREEHGDSLTFWNIEAKQAQVSIASDFFSFASTPDRSSFATFRRKDSRRFNKVNDVLLWRMDQLPVLTKQHRITTSLVAFAPDLKTFAAGDNLPDGSGQIAMWDMMTGERRWSVTFNARGHSLVFLSFIGDGKLLSATCGSAHSGWHTTLWDVTSTPIEKVSVSTVLPAISSPDGEWLAIPLDLGAKLIRVSAPKREYDLSVIGDGAALMKQPMPSFSPDSKMMLVQGLDRLAQKPFLEDWLSENYNPFRAGRGGRVVRVWNTENQREVAAFHQCREAWFSPDGQVLATLRVGRNAIDLWKVPFRASLWHIFEWTVIGWLIAVSVGWVGVKIRRRMISRTNGPLHRVEINGEKQQPADSKESPPLLHDLPPPADA